MVNFLAALDVNLHLSNHESVRLFSDAAPSYYCTCLLPLSGDGKGKKRGGREGGGMI